MRFTTGVYLRLRYQDHCCENQHNGMKAKEARWNRVVRPTVASYQLVLVAAFMIPVPIARYMS